MLSQTYFNFAVHFNWWLIDESLKFLSFFPLSACYKHQVDLINININFPLFGCMYLFLRWDLCSRERRGYPHVIVSLALGYLNECEAVLNSEIFICFPVFKKLSNSLMNTRLRVGKWPYWHFFLSNTDKNVAMWNHS